MTAREMQWALVVACALGMGACEPERPPAPSAEAVKQGATAASDQVWLEQGASKVVLSYAGERGRFEDTGDPAEVPERARGLVRVTLLEGPKPAPSQVWVANLRELEADGRWRLQTVPRDLFEELALGEGLSSDVVLPEGLQPPDKIDRTSEIVVYATAWCGVCRKLTAYLDRKGVAYVEKDIEKDQKAAAELVAKARKAGINASSVPVVDVRGELMVGFQRARLEKLLQ
jgi:glutaredoxin